MPIESPKLDDLAFESVFQNLLKRIPIYTREWTNFNESDPGITLIQLFSYLAEQVGYRLNRVPDKNYIEFLKLVGVHLRPADAAQTKIALLLSKPETTLAFTVPAGSTAKSTIGDSPPIYETAEDIVAVPAQLATLVTTLHGDLRNLARGINGGPDPILPGQDADQYLDDRFALAWNGKLPKPKDMPTLPVPLFYGTAASHRNLWLGLAFNPMRPAGFVGQRVTLTIQLDDDEQPDSSAWSNCGSVGDSFSLPASERIRYWYYRPAIPGEEIGSWRVLRPLVDTTANWSLSGLLRFDVPSQIGPIPNGEWAAVRSESVKTAADVCAEIAGTDVAAPEPIAHPLIGALKVPVEGTPNQVPVSGWIRVEFLDGGQPLSVRAVCFNVAHVDHAKTVHTELVGRGNGLPGQTFRLQNQNLLESSLTLAVENLDIGQLQVWERVHDFDSAGPLAQVYLVDRESGDISFGSGIHGFPPQNLVRIVALSYRYGGGSDGESPVGAVTIADSMPAEITDVTNIVAATGGHNAETLAEAKERAPKALKTLERAVTSEDYVFLALRTPSVRVARAHVVPLRRPRPAVAGPGLDTDTEMGAPGALALIVIPDEKGLHPTPTKGMLRLVCEYLNDYRLITTELYVVPPQYVRLFDMSVRVRATPGYSVADLREAIAEDLERHFHVLSEQDRHSGFPFGGVLHHADLVARIFDIAGVDRVEGVEVQFDGQAPHEPGQSPAHRWRSERQIARRLSNCPSGPSETDHIDLAPDECLFVDSGDLLVSVIE